MQVADEFGNDVVMQVQPGAGVSVEEAGVIATRNAVVIMIGSVLWFYLVYKLFRRR
jgi:predicted MFS family arabinose efflux permease